MHDITDLHFYGLEVRQTNAFKRGGYFYVEDLLGTKPWDTVLAHGPGPAYLDDDNASFVQLDAWYEYRYRHAWKDLPSIGMLAIGLTLQALDRWRAYNRENPLQTL